ncbi:MAG: BamA/TamA family outer membrane protein, partial [Flavobacteriales bacterium]|nr:BamA/TamA family outer membrane protein [Flavobacteriales bacterium]
RFFQSYNFSFTEPWLGGKKPLSFTLGAFHSLNNLGSWSGSDGRIMSTSVYSSLGKRLRWPDDFFNILFTLRYERYHLRNYMLIPNFSNGTSHKLSLSAVLSRNSTNEIIFPSRGSDLMLSAEGTAPYSLLSPVKNPESRPPEEKYKLLEYYKIKFSAKFYSGVGGPKLSQKLVVYNRLEGGVLGAYNKALGAPPFERFLLGGDGLSAIGFNNQFLGREVIALRGYRDGTLTPGYSPSTPPTGGTAYVKTTTELRFLISGNPAAKIFVLAFVEAGNSWDSFKEFSAFRVNRAVGAGLRLFLPMFGLLGIDYGYGFDPIRNTPESARQKGGFHFMIGQQF